MEATEILAGARDGLTDMTERCARLIEEIADTSIPIPGSEWTVREAAVHLASASRIWGKRFTGAEDVPAVPLDKEILAARFRSMFADNPESDPKKLAEQIRESFGVLMEVIATVAPDRPIAYYAGLRPTVAELCSQFVGEPILHGYDIASAVGVPWQIEPRYAAVAVRSYQRVLCSLSFQPAASVGFEATYRFEVDGIDPFHVRIAGGTYTPVDAHGSVDCVISTDPATALLVISGRLSQWPAIALGRLNFTGDRPELGPRFADLFVFP